MDLELSDDQTALADGVASLCAGRFPIETVRAMAESGLDRDRWRELAETGVFALCLPEGDADGVGVGLGWAEAAVVFEQLGRALVPGPLVASTLAAGVITGAADGSTVVGSVERTGGAVFVEHLPWIDQLVIRDADGLWVVDAADLDSRPAGQLARPPDPGGAGRRAAQRRPDR